MNNMDHMNSALELMKQKYQEGVGARNLLLAQQLEKTDSLISLRHEIRHLDAEQVVLSHTSRSMMNDLVSRMEEPVSMALQLLWEDDRLFRFRFDTYRGEPGAWREVGKREWRITSDTEFEEGEYEYFDPDEQSGGGVSDIVSLIQDLSFSQLLDPPPQGLFSRDEPAKHVDRQGGDKKTENVAFFLKEFVREAGLQFLFITHNSKLAEIAEVAYEVQKVKEMTSKVVRIK